MLDFHAGKYAAYVWPAYGFTVIVIGAMAADTLARARRWRRQVDAREAAQDEAHTPVAQPPKADPRAAPEPRSGPQPEPRPEPKA